MPRQKKTTTIPQELEKPPVLPPVDRSAEGVRDALFDELNLLRAGRVSTSHARAVAQVCRNIIEAARLELAHKQFLKQIQQSNGAGSNLRDGRKQLGGE